MHPITARHSPTDRRRHQAGIGAWPGLRLRLGLGLGLGPCPRLVATYEYSLCHHNNCTFSHTQACLRERDRERDSTILDVSCQLVYFPAEAEASTPSPAAAPASDVASLAAPLFFVVHFYCIFQAITLNITSSNSSSRQGQQLSLSLSLHLSLRLSVHLSLRLFVCQTHCQRLRLSRLSANLNSHFVLI